VIQDRVSPPTASSTSTRKTRADTGRHLARHLTSGPSLLSIEPIVFRETPSSEKPAMPTLIEKPVRIEAAGNKPKLIDEFVGRVNTRDSAVSIARMRSPSGWIEPGQRPEFDEYTIVLAGSLRVEHEAGQFDVEAGQSVVVRRGEWVRYSTPGSQGAEYIAVCLPAFSIETVHRDAS
jgi:ethanolamine utilization protein EutQ